MRNARETRGASRMAQLLVLAAGGSIAFNDDLDTALMAGDLIVKALTFVAGPSRSWAVGINRVAFDCSMARTARASSSSLRALPLITLDSMPGSRKLELKSVPA